METNVKNPARKNPEVRAAMKQQQLARLAAKAAVKAGDITTEEYVAMYNNQPQQVAKLKQQQAQAAARNAVRKAAVSGDISSANAGADAFKLGGAS